MFSRKPHDQFPYINGSRGRYLLTSAVIYILMGISFIPMRHGDIRARFFGWMQEFNIEPGVLGWVWLVSALPVLIGAWLRRPADRWAFAAAYTAPTIMTFAYIVSFWFTRNPQALVGGATFVFFSLMSLIVAGMEGEEEREERVRHAAEKAARRHQAPVTTDGGET
jgi:hypothetical protein